MEFKKPQPLKRNSDGSGFNSPCNRKKTKLHSTTIATPEIRKNPADPFDDNFTQFFQSQFIKQIPELETSFIQAAQNLNKTVSSNDYNFTQCDGLSQFMYESQLESSIISAQRCLDNELIIRDGSEEETNQNQELEVAKPINEHEKLEFTLKEVIDDDDQCEQHENHPIENDNEEAEHEAELTIQSSQLFLKELTALQLNISSIVDETLNANKFNTQDFLDPSNEQFDVYKSSVCNSQYLQLKQPNEPTKLVTTPPNHVPKAISSISPRTDFNTEMIEDQLLAQMITTTQVLANNTELLEDQLLAAYNDDDELNVSERLNECIDPNSSALAILSDEDDKENNQHVEIQPKFEGTSEQKEQHGERTPLNVRHTSLRAIQQTETRHHSPVTASNYFSMGPFFGLPLQVKKLIKTFKNIDDLYDWQKECLQLPAIEQKRNLIYALPTSGGKTLVSEILIFREILCRQKSCLFILPYVSIVQEKVWSLSPFALELKFLIEEYAAGKGSVPPRKRRNKKSVYIATIEKALVLFDSLIEAGRTNEIGLVIIDELHIIGESGRGAVLESLLTKIQFIKANIQIVGMSATIGNLPELAKFLEADVYQKDFRPVELREFVKCGADILEVKKDADCIENAFVVDRTVSFNYKADALKKDPDQVAGLVSEVIPEKSCLVFCSTKKYCESLAKLLCIMLPKKFLNHKSVERGNLIKAIESDMGSPICPILEKSIMCGIAYHHSGLTGDERRHLEEAFRCGVLCVICCTSTLAAGVNLPAKRVIIRSPYVGRDFITLSKYKQMVGRAGRAGFGEAGESIMICAPQDNQRVSELLCSPMDEVVSQMPNCDSRALEAMILSAIGLNIASTQAELQKLVARTMFSIQASRFLDTDAKSLTNDIIEKLIRSKAITPAADITVQLVDSGSSSQSTHESSFYQNITLSQKKRVVLKSSTKLQVEMLGKSSFKSGIDFNRSKIVYTDLQKAQQSLVLLDYFHLLYIVTPYDEYNPPPMPDRNTFYNEYSKLNRNELHTARVIGITESTASKLMSGQMLKPDQERAIKKFFMTMVLNELWHLKPVSETAILFGIDRGVVQNLMGMAAIEASCLLKFCEELEEFWAFRELFKNLSQRLSNICTVELVPLMQLPSVKMGRAKQLFNAGYKKIEDIARAKPKDLVSNIEHMNYRLAHQLVSAAKVMLLEKLENLQEEAQECMEVYLS